MPLAQAALNNNLSQTQTQIGETAAGIGFLKMFFAWASVFIGFVGVIMLISSLFLYLVATGEEPKMKKANLLIWGGIYSLIGAVVIYLIGLWAA